MDLTRSIPTALLAALQRHFHPVLMVALDWPDGWVYAHSGVGTIAWDSKSWGGVGEFGQIAVPEEQAGMAAVSSRLVVTGLPPDVLDRLDDAIRGRDGQIWFGATTERAGNVLVADPVSLFAGAMDALRYQMERRSDGGQTVIEHGLVLELGSGPGARSVASLTHSYEDQIAAYPGDTAGRHLIHAQANLEKITWPET